MSAPPSIRAALDAAAGILREAGLAGARREAQVLLGHALGVGREVVIGAPDRPLGGGEAAAFEALVARRAAREPVAHIFGAREFWSLDVLVTRDTLIPRPDSETVVEAALAEIADHRAALRLLDLGAGTGCLLLALLSELSQASGVGVDISAPALTVARANAKRLGHAPRARFLCGDWGRPLAGAFDLIVANPPYIGDGEAAALEPEVVVYEPSLALSGGADGLAGYRALAPDAARLLAPGGAAVIEVGAGQADAVAAIMAGHGLVEAGRRRDLAGLERCVVLRRNDRKKPLA